MRLDGMKRLLIIGLIMAGMSGFSWAGEESVGMDDLKSYYTKEKAYWDQFLETNCAPGIETKKCQVAQKMQETYVYLLTDLMRDKAVQRVRRSEPTRVVYEVPLAPSPVEESAALVEPQTAAEDIP